MVQRQAIACRASFAVTSTEGTACSQEASRRPWLAWDGHYRAVRLLRLCFWLLVVCIQSSLQLASLWVACGLPGFTCLACPDSLCFSLQQRYGENLDKKEGNLHQMLRSLGEFDLQKQVLKNQPMVDISDEHLGRLSLQRTVRRRNGSFYASMGC